MGKKKNNSHCLHAMMCSFLVLVSLVILISLYKDYKYRQIYGKVDMSQQRRHFHKSAYKTQLSQSSTVKQNNNNEQSPAPELLKTPFYSTESVLETVQLNLTKFGGPVQGQVRYVSKRDADAKISAISPTGTVPSSSVSHKKVISFLGIPYAQPPVGNRQFETAKMSISWKTPLNASRQPSKCPQGAHFFSAISDMNSSDDTESEDCLYLNIWTPYNNVNPQRARLVPSSPTSNNTSNKKLKAVLVYFHSGLFSFGTIASHDFDPSNLVSREDIIVVTVQFRLGALGFASFDIDSAGSGEHMSLGLSDQVRALQWIHANIAAFGGDSKQITLVGHGSGAVMIGAHVLNPSTNQLFHRVIVQGYQNLLNVGLYGLNERATKTLWDELGCSSDNPTVNNTMLALKKCAQKNKIKPSSIVEYQHFMFEKHAIPFGPEFNPFTRRLIEMIRENKTAGQKPNISELIHLFHDWNLFPKNIQFLIGLNSDDDYKLDSTNRFNTGIHFDEEEEEDTEETDSQADNSGSTHAESDNKGNNNKNYETSDGTTKEKSKVSAALKMENNTEESIDEHNENDENDSEDTQDGDQDQEGNMALNSQNDDKNIPDNVTPTSTVKSLRKADETTTISNIGDSYETVSVEEDEITTESPRMVAPTTVSSKRNQTSRSMTAIAPKRKQRSLLERIRRAAKIDTSGSVTKLFHLENDEIAKLCRIVRFYRTLKKDSISSSQDIVSSKVTLYRIDPRVLQNPLEEVSLAFGARSKKWLRNFDDHVMSLWSSFVKNGDILSGDQSLLPNYEQDSVNFINLEQKDFPSELETQAPNEIHDSVLSWQTFTDLKAHCDSI